MALEAVYVLNGTV